MSGRLLEPVQDVFRAVATTVVPEASGLRADEWAEVQRLVEGALAQRPPEMQRQLVKFLGVIELLPMLRYARRFTHLSAERRLAVLNGLQDSRVSLLRRGCWGVRTLVFLGYYARPSLARAIGYRASAAGWSARRPPNGETPPTRGAARTDGGSVAAPVGSAAAAEPPASTTIRPPAMVAALPSELPTEFAGEAGAAAQAPAELPPARLGNPLLIDGVIPASVLPFSSAATPALTGTDSPAAPLLSATDETRQTSAPTELGGVTLTRDVTDAVPVPAIAPSLDAGGERGRDAADGPVPSVDHVSDEDAAMLADVDSPSESTPAPLLQPANAPLAVPGSPTTMDSGAAPESTAMPTPPHPDPARRRRGRRRRRR